jgi:endonuclease-3 related protein
MLKRIYRQLFKHYGPQHWWPAESPFEVMVGAVLTQNTAWINVERAIANLRQADLLDPVSLSALDQTELADYLRPAGYFNIKAKRLQALTRFLLHHQQLDHLDTEELRQMLLGVHGIGPETADDILLYAFQRPVFVIDAYTRRMFSRLGLVDEGSSYETLREHFESSLELDVEMFNEYHALIVQHAKHVCRTKPKCQTCLLSSGCDYSNGQN